MTDGLVIFSINAEISNHQEQLIKPRACSSCLWLGVECKNQQLYKPADETDKRNKIDCGAWSYCD